MVFENIGFEKSISELNQSPKDVGSEVAFVGRSNDCLLYTSDAADE